MSRHSDWVETDNDDNATSTATRAAVANQSHYITSVAGGYSAANVGNTLILKQGSTELGRWRVNSSLAIPFSCPIRLEPNTVANLELEASGAGGQIGSVTMTGYTL